MHAAAISAPNAAARRLRVSDPLGKAGENLEAMTNLFFFLLIDEASRSAARVGYLWGGARIASRRERSWDLEVSCSAPRDAPP
jgi:hypothetical protein